jgi:hypothetical protein
MLVTFIGGIMDREMKYNMRYKGYRHFGEDKVFMDIAFFATAFNIKKMFARMKRTT